MKRLFIVALFALAGASTYAQGYVALVNGTASLVTTCDSSGNIVPMPVGTRFLLELYYAPDGPDPGNQGMIQGVMGQAMSVVPVPGRFSGGVRPTPSSTARGAHAWFQVRAWESAFGGTFEEAIASGPRDIEGVTRMAYVGMSTRFNIATGEPASPTALFTAGGFTGLFAGPLECPEPSTTVLSIVGGLGSLLLIRAAREQRNRG